MIHPGFLAGAFRIGEENSIRALIPSGSTVSQVLIYFGALFLVALAVIAWAVFRTQHRGRHSHHHRLKPASKHQRQHKHRLRHPTLAEAGGLPPVRAEKPPPSPA
jgi:ABC-type nickel/cobalt efflux system permease component RcnA